MPDTLPKFGEDCRSSFRDLGLTKILIVENEDSLINFLEESLRKFIPQPVHDVRNVKRCGSVTILSFSFTKIV